MNFTITQVNKLTDKHWDLLLLADPNKDLVQKYLQAAITFEVRKKKNCLLSWFYKQFRSLN